MPSSALPALLLATAVAGCAAPALPIIEAEPGEADEVLDGKADGAEEPRVELKLTIEPDDIRRARYRLSLRNDRSELRAIWFYDTPWLDLLDAGVALRARSIDGDDDDSTVKLRSLGRDDVDPRWFALDGFKCETDRLVDRETPSCSLSAVEDEGEIEEVADGERAIDKLFSAEQEELLAEHGPPIDWAELAPLGPIPARVWKLRTDVLPAKATAELWYLPDQSQVLELSMKVAPADADAGLEQLLDLLDAVDLRLADQQETKTRRALELLAR